MLSGSALPCSEHRVDVCVVGGGMAGVCAAVSAARHGAKVLLMHERPVLGGNASSEMRMHICGADRHGSIANLRETGILEELRLLNLTRNPNRNPYIWDLLLYETCNFQPGLELLLNCSCLDAKMDSDRILSISGWQQTTQTIHSVEADIFIDCSGDAILAPLSGADSTMGREARSQFSESIAPEIADKRTMGMTCLFGAREYDTSQPFKAPDWAYTFKDDSELPYGKSEHESWWTLGYWWIELGGESDSILDTESIRDELLKVTLGVWDHIKNYGDHGAENWALDWLQFLPAKRESRRYLGEYILNQNDISAGGVFEDTVAYGGWSMDDHNPAGFWAVKKDAPATIFHHAPSPYGIPYRSLYSRNIKNLMFAGRDASCTHAAMSSTRVMGTACSMGQAAGTAAALAATNALLPSEIKGEQVARLQQLLILDDAYLPGVRMQIPEAVLQAKLSASCGDPEPLRDGINRPLGNDIHAWKCSPGDWAEYIFKHRVSVKNITLVVNSALDKNIAQSQHVPPTGHDTVLPAELPKEIRIEGLISGEWTELKTITDNCARLITADINVYLSGVRITLESTWGAEPTWIHLFTLDT